MSLAAGLIVSLVAAGCAGGGAATEAAKVEAAIERAQSGELIEAIDATHAAAAADEAAAAVLRSEDAAGEAVAEAVEAARGAAEEGAQAVASSKITLEDIAVAFTMAAKAGGEFESFGLEKYRREKPAKDPCPTVKKSAKGLDDAGLAAQAAALGACLRPMLKEREVYAGARNVVKYFELPAGTKLSKMTPAEIETYIDRPAPAGSDGASAAPVLRSQFSDEALEDLQALAELSFKSLLDAEAKAVAAADERPALIEALAKKSNRWALLAALAKEYGDLQGLKLATASIVAITGKAPTEDLAALLAKFPVAMMHAYDVLALVPDEKADLSPLGGSGENPISLMLAALGSLEGPEATVTKTLRNYRMARDIDNPALPVRSPSEADAVRVAVLDSGVDFRNFTDLGLFLGLGRKGELASYDYADGDANPWALGIGSMAHGTGTAATVLTMVARNSPETLRERKFEIAAWKAWTIRDVLAGSGVGSFQNRLGVYDAIVRNIKAEVKPKIVSMSLGFKFNALNEGDGKDPAILKKAPWLWVMAAGNEGSDVSERTKAGGVASCFDDVAPANRNDARILCVGALAQGIVNDEVAYYTNFGPRVDVYAYDTYTKTCPNGTSCSTPAVAGAAAVIAAKFPCLPVENIRKAIVNAAEMRSLKVQADPDMKNVFMIMGMDMPAPKTVTVPVFDPATMMEKALKEAAKLSSIWATAAATK